VVTDPQTHKPTHTHTHRQDRLQYIALLHTLGSSQNEAKSFAASLQYNSAWNIQAATTTADKHTQTHSISMLSTFITFSFAFSAPTLSVGKGIRPVKIGCWFVGSDDVTGALYVSQLHLLPPPPSPLAPVSPEWRHASTG